MDFNNAFADPDIHAIITSIWGEDSVRIQPYLDQKVITSNPKIIMGFSDSTTFLTLLNQWGLTTFHDPSVIAGFAQLESFPQVFNVHLQKIESNIEHRKK